MEIIQIDVVGLSVQQKVSENSDYVVSTALSLTAQDTELGMGSIFHFAFSFPVVENSPDFIPFDELTADIVINWCKSSTEQWDALIKHIEDRFNILRNPEQQIVNKLPPWIPKANPIIDVNASPGTNPRPIASAPSETVPIEQLSSLNSPTNYSVNQEEYLRALIYQVLEEIKNESI